MDANPPPGQMPMTPGQVAFTAYWRRKATGVARATTEQIWHALSPALRDPWEAAAQAVLALKEESDE